MHVAAGIDYQANDDNNSQPLARTQHMQSDKLIYEALWAANRTWTCQLIRIYKLDGRRSTFITHHDAFLSILQTDQLKRDIRHKVLEIDLEEFERPTFNQTALKMLLDNVRSLTDNTAQAVNSLEKIIYLIQNTRHDSLGHYLGVSTPISRIWFTSELNRE